MKKRLYSFGIILTIISFFIFSSIVSSLTRPNSISCLFKGEIIDFKETTVNIERYDLTIMVLSHEPLLPEGDYSVKDRSIFEEMCSFLDSTTVNGTWYAPGQDYTKDQPYVDKNNVLVKGSIIDGGIDSYDNIIKNVVLIKEDTKSDIADDKSNNTNFAIIVIFLIILISIVILFFKKFKH